MRCWICWLVGAALATLAVCGWGGSLTAAEIRGEYMESRTCDIYTGPCFANSEVGLTGREAILAFHIEEGRHDGVDLSGMKVVVAVVANDTLGFGGGLVVHPDPIRSVVLVDERATPEQQTALVDFVRQRAAKVAGQIVRVSSASIEMKVDYIHHSAQLTAGREVELSTRALGAADHCCTNEIVFYPPLAEVENSVPAFTKSSKFSGKGLGSRWSSPNSRSAFLATFAY